jgi:hypothetical protein
MAENQQKQTLGLIGNATSTNRVHVRAAQSPTPKVATEHRVLGCSAPGVPWNQLSIGTPQRRLAWGSFRRLRTLFPGWRRSLRSLFSGKNPTRT